MSKILVITGSPRKDGNSDMLADAFIKGANSSGNEVTKLSAAHMDIAGCLACDYCLKNEGTCIQKDDMQKVYDAIYSADTLVFATPVYFFGMTAQIKSVIDRLYAAMAKPLPVKSSVLLVSLGGSAETDATDTISTYQTMAKYLNWENKGMVVVDNVNGKGEITGNPALLEAEVLGRNLG